jgi:hypothetical protein
MATTTPEHFGTLAHGRDQRFLRTLVAESTSESLAGAAALVLAIIGLAGMATSYMMAIGVIALGVAFLFDGAVAMTGAWETPEIMLGSHRSAAVLGGAAGVVLGILALIGVVPLILCSCAILVFGACMLVATGMEGGMRRWNAAPGEEPKMMEAEEEYAEPGTRPLVALAAIVLGLLAIVNIASAVLTLIGVLVLGASFVINGPAMTTRWSKALHWTH